MSTFTSRQFFDQIMHRLWAHFSSPFSAADKMRVASDYYAALSHYDKDRLLEAVGKIVVSWEGTHIPKIAEFYRFLPPIDESRQLTYNEGPRTGPPPGLLRYIFIASGKRSMFANSIRNALRDKEDLGVLPKVAGDTYMERLRNCVKLAREEGAPLRTIKILEEASK